MHFKKLLIHLFIYLYLYIYIYIYKEIYSDRKRRSYRDRERQTNQGKVMLWFKKEKELMLEILLIVKMR